MCISDGKSSLSMMRLSLAIISEGERIFLRELYTIMCKQVDRGVLSLCFVLLYSPSVAKRQLSLLLELKKMTQNHPATT